MHAPSLLKKQYLSLYTAIVLVLIIVGCTSTSEKTKILITPSNLTPQSAVSSGTTASQTIEPTSKVTTLEIGTSTPVFTPLPKFPTAEKIPTSTINQLSPKIVPASEIINTSKISTFFPEHTLPLTIALDDKYVYWVDHRDPGLLYRISLLGGTPEVAARSLYDDGRLDCVDLQTSEHWLILCDTSRSKDLTIWKIRAINLDDLSQTVLLSDNNRSNLITLFDISLDGNSVIWVITTLKDNKLDENIVTLVNLDTGERRDILHKKADTSIWSVISLSGNQAVIEQDYDETQGGKNVLHLLDLSNGNLSDLSLGGESSMPEFFFPWMIWKQGARFRFVRSFVIYNLDDDQKSLIPNLGRDPIDPMINGSWVYWRDNPKTFEKGNAIYIYNIEKNMTYVLETPGPDQFYREVYIYGNKIAWTRELEYSKANHNACLEWATIE